MDSSLRAAAQQALEALTSRDGDGWTRRFARDRAIEALEAALAEPVQKPVAWRFEARHIDSAWAAAVTLKHPGPEGVYMRNVTPLYTAPPQRKPLSDADLAKIWDDALDQLDQRDQLRFIARAIERAHGIGGQP